MFCFVYRLNSQVGGGKRQADPVEGVASKSRRIEEPKPSSSRIVSPVQHISNNSKVECSVCKVFVSKRYLSSHLKTNTHKNNVITCHENLANVQVIESAFGQRIKTYRITSESDVSCLNVETPELFLFGIKSTLLQLITISLSELNAVKLNFILHADFVQQTKELQNSFDFQTTNYTCCKSDDQDSIICSIFNDITEKLSNFEKKDSGWSLKQIKHIDMNINKYNPLRGSSFIDLPRDIKLKKAVINVKNNDIQCFQWAVLSALYPVDQNAERVTKYISHKNKLNFSNISFPVKLKDVHKFEKLNDISINVFGLEYDSESRKNKVIGPLHFTKCRKPTHINLLYITNVNNNINHYCYIKNLSRLVSNQINDHHATIYICDGCLLYFQTRERLNDHQQLDCNHIRTDLPNDKKRPNRWFGESLPNNKLSFNNFDKTLKMPFVIYADFESFLNPVQTCDNDPTKSFTNNVQKHDVYSFGYYIKCSYDDKQSIYRHYTGQNCSHFFMKSLKDDLMKISQKLFFQLSPVPLTCNNNHDVSQSTICFICKKNLNNDSTIYYDWFTGLYKGVAHSICASNYRVPRFVPIFLHNLSNYDAHFIVHALNFEEGEITIIPQNKEKYISFSKKIKLNNNTIELRFLDSFKFMSCSLATLAQNLETHQLHELRKNFTEEEDFKRLVKKGIFPYECMTSFSVLKQNCLPIQNKFYNSLTNETISDENYKHAQDVWNHFDCKNMCDYSDLYLKTDVLLLTDIFENFRNLCLTTYDLDPAHYYTAPGLSWDAMLKYTKENLELLTDFDKIAFVKKGIRGGISQCSNRHAKANNMFMEDFNDKLPSSYLIYLDANNLYGWAMSQYLPIGEFEWVDVNVDFNVPNDSKYGFILEVDLEYPDPLHDSHSDLPFCPDSICTENCKEKKLIPNLNNKSKYIIHYRNLKQCLEHGLILTKVHRVLKFKQSAWLKKYIDLNTNLRALAKSDFQKDFYKLMNNSVFGKTMENIEKRVNVKLLTHWDNHGKVQGAQRLISQPEFHSLSIFSETLVAIQLKKTKCMYNKPIYLGFCILDISKTLMYSFHYNYMNVKFQNNLKLLYTDTDSFIYQIFTNNFYSDIKQDVLNYFDTSDYPSNNKYGLPQVNKKKLGLFKDENHGKIFKEFVGLRSKMYAIDVESKLTTKAKGVNKNVSKHFVMDHYKSSLFNKKIHISEMLRFKSIKHVIYTQKINKVSLSHNDTKRYLLENTTDTLAWGHYKLRKL